MRLLNVKYFILIPVKDFLTHSVNANIQHKGIIGHRSSVLNLFKERSVCLTS
jgi:hypothetical protein